MDSLLITLQFQYLLLLSRGYTGKGIVVTILDDGIQPNHPDLIDNYVSPVHKLFISNYNYDVCAYDRTHSPAMISMITIPTPPLKITAIISE